MPHPPLRRCRPPRGWRSWNLYGNNVNQSLITGIMDGMVTKHSYGGAKDTSLCEGFGYCDVGLDDHWQMCGSPDAAPGMNYHDKEGNPIVNLKVFPDLGAMAKHAHSLKLTSGWCELREPRAGVAARASLTDPLLVCRAQMATTATAPTTVTRARSVGRARSARCR